MYITYIHAHFNGLSLFILSLPDSHYSFIIQLLWSVISPHGLVDALKMQHDGYQNYPISELPVRLYDSIFV